jgi:hypothetical protein
MAAAVATDEWPRRHLCHVHREAAGLSLAYCFLNSARSIARVVGIGAAACRLAVEECVDTGVSAPRATARRAIKLLEAAGLRQVGQVLCWRLDRRGRSVNNTVDTPRRLAGYEVHFLAVRQA